MVAVSDSTFIINVLYSLCLHPHPEGCQLKRGLHRLRLFVHAVRFRTNGPNLVFGDFFL